MNQDLRDAHVEAQTELLRMIVRLLLIYFSSSDKHYCMRDSADDYWNHLRALDSKLKTSYNTNQQGTEQ